MPATVPATILIPPTPPNILGATYGHTRDYSPSKDSNDAGNMLPRIPRRVSSSSPSRPRFQVGPSFSSSSSSSSSSDEDHAGDIAIGEDDEDQDDTPRPSLESSAVDCTTPTPAPVSRKLVEEVASTSNENTPVFPGIAARTKRGRTMPSATLKLTQDIDATSPPSPLLSPSAAPIIPQSSAQVSTITFPSSNINHIKAHDSLANPIPTLYAAPNSTSAIPFPVQVEPESPISFASVSPSSSPSSSLASKRKISGTLKLNFGNMPNVLRMPRGNEKVEPSDQVEVPRALAPSAPIPVIRKKSGEVVKPSLKHRIASLPHGNRSRPSLEGLFSQGGFPPGSPSLSAPATPLAGPGLSFSQSMPAVSRYSRSGSVSMYSSTVTTPVKNVHFDTKLEHVKLFLAGQKPAAVSRDGSPDEFTTGDSASDGEGWSYFNKGSGKKYMNGSDSEEAVKKGLEMKLLNMECLSNGENRNLRPPFNVRLATLKLSADKTAIEGSVVVKNLAFEKWVAVRFTFDSWMTTSEVAAKWDRPWIPPPTFYHAPPHALASVSGTASEEKQEIFDLFSFRIRLTDLIPRIANKTLVLAVRYSIHGKEMWDNNGGGDYRASFEVHQRGEPAGLSANVNVKSSEHEKDKEKERGNISSRLRKELERVARESASDQDSPAHTPLPSFLNNADSGKHSLASRYDFAEALKNKNKWKPELSLSSPRFGAHSRTNTYPGVPWSASRQTSPVSQQSWTQHTPPHRQQTLHHQYDDHHIPQNSFVALARSRGSPREANGDNDDQNSAFFGTGTIDTGSRRGSIGADSSSRNHQRSYFELWVRDSSSSRDGYGFSQVKKTDTTGTAKPLVASPDSEEKSKFKGLGIEFSAADSSSTIFTPSPSASSASGGFLIRAMSDSEVVTSATPSPRSATPIPDIMRTSSSPSPPRSQSFPPSSPNVTALAPAPIISESSSSHLSASSKTRAYPRHPWSSVLNGNPSEDNSTPSTASLLSPSLSSALSSSIPSPLSPSDVDYSMMQIADVSVPHSAPADTGGSFRGVEGGSSSQDDSGSNDYSYLLDRFCFYTGAFDNIHSPSSPGGMRRSNSASTIEDYLSATSSPSRDSVSTFSGNGKYASRIGRTPTMPYGTLSPSMSDISLSGYVTPTSPTSMIHSSPLSNAIHV